MELDHIKEFLTLASERNYSKAADKMYLSQSVLTKHIQKLEAELGFNLFIRTSPLRLTPAGEYLRTELQREYESFETTISKAKEVSEGYAGTLSLGLSNYSKNIYVPDIRIFRKKYPGTKVNTVIKDQNELFSALTNDEVDIATLYNINVPTNRSLDQFERAPIINGKMGILVNKTDKRFRQKETISIYDLKGMKYLQINNTYYRTMYSSMEVLAKNYMIDFRSTVSVPSLEDALLHVLMDGDILFVPGSGSDISYGQEFRKLYIEEPEFTYTRYYLWKPTNTNSSILKYITVARDRRAADISRRVLANMEK